MNHRALIRVDVEAEVGKILFSLLSETILENSEPIKVNSILRIVDCGDLLIDVNFDSLAALHPFIMEKIRCNEEVAGTQIYQLNKIHSFIDSNDFIDNADQGMILCIKCKSSEDELAIDALKELQKQDLIIPVSLWSSYSAMDTDLILSIACEDWQQAFTILEDEIRLAAGIQDVIAFLVYEAYRN